MRAGAAARAIRMRRDMRGLWAGGLLAAGLALVTAQSARGQDVIVSHGISTYGDLQLPADFTHLPYVNPDAPKGGEISQGTFGGFDTMNPFSVQGRAAVGSSMMLETMLVGTADEIGASYCLLCTTMEYPEDRSWVIFNLRDDITFSDGTPMTAEDVAFSFETFLTKGLSDFRTVFAENVEGAEVLDPYRIRFTFTENAPLHEMPQTVGGLPVFSKAQFERENRDLEQSSLTPFIGSGPYVADKIDVGRSISYRRNPDYWGRDLPINRGQDNFDSIRYEYFAEPNAAFEAFKAGVYNFRVESTSRIWAEQYTFPALTNGFVKKETLPSGAKATGQAFVFNLRRDNWQDPKVRRAISMMFNFEWSNKTLFYGLYSRVNSFWENSWLEAEGTPSPEEVAILKPLVDEGLLPAEILTADPVMAPVSTPDRQRDPANQRAAGLLLDEAGWTVQPPPAYERMSWLYSALLIAGVGAVALLVVTRPALAGRRAVAGVVAVAAVAGVGWWSRTDIQPADDFMRRNADGQVLRIEVLEDNPQFERIIAPFVENLRSLGIDASLNLIDSAQYEVRVRNPEYDFDLTTSFTRTDYFSGAELKQFYGSATADVSVFNAAGLKSPAVDRLIDVVLGVKSRDELTVATKALDRVLRAEQFRIPQWYNPDHWVAYYDMFEHPEVLPPYALGETSFWWFNPEKAEALRAAGALR